MTKVDENDIVLSQNKMYREEPAMLEIKDLSFRVDGEAGSELEIIDHVSFTVEDGKFVVVTGPNGGGKSTLAKLIMGIEQPTEGTILYNGQDVTHMSVTERARIGIGYAFQQPPRFKGLTVRKLLSLAYGSTLPEDVCCNYLTEVGLCSKDYLNRDIDASLSGGEVKRIEIATLMARNPGLAIFDEPEAGIDLWSFAMLVDTFKKLHDKGRKQHDDYLPSGAHYDAGRPDSGYGPWPYPHGWYARRGSADAARRVCLRM